MLGSETKDEMQYHGRVRTTTTTLHTTSGTSWEGDPCSVTHTSAAVRPVVAPDLRPGEQPKDQDPGQRYVMIPDADAGTKA